MNREPATSPQGRDAVDTATEAALNAYAETVGSDDFDLPAGVTVHAPSGPQAGRAYLERFVSDDELDRIASGGRPSLSGAGTSPKRQVRLPAELDAALDDLAKKQGRKPSAVMRDAIETYVRSA